jgi:WD40 repeat protein
MHRLRFTTRARLRIAEILAFLLVCVGTWAPSDLAGQFQMLETGDMRLVSTSPLQSVLVPQVARSFENALRFHRDLFDYTPRGKIDVLMHDLWHYGNGGARPVPENHITVGIEPYAHVYESSPAPERMTSTFNHELAHIVTTDKATSSDRFFRSVFFGKVTPNAEEPLSMLYAYLTTPRWYSPRWYLEGIAVYLETWMNGGLGRVNGPYDEMVFRTLVRDSGTIYDVVGLESEGTTIDFQVGVNSYLYGTRFISYLALQHGNDSLLAWFNRTEGSRRYFSSQFRHVYGTSLEDEWSRWIAWERDWQRANLQKIRQQPTTAFRALTDQALGSVSRAYYDSASGNIYVAVRYPGQVAHIAAIDIESGRLVKVREVLGASGFYVTSLAFDPASRTLFYTTNNADWRHLVALELETGRFRVLLRDVRLGDLVFNPADRSLWGVRHADGLSTLVRIPPPYEEWNRIHTLPYGRDLFDLDISPDGSTLIGSMSEISGLQQLVRMDIAALMEGDTTHEVLSDEFEDSPPSNFVFSPDGRYLFGSSYISGVSNIFRYDFDTGVVDPLSNAETGFFKPVAVSEDSIVVFRYTGRGFVPSMIPNEVPDSVSAIQFLGPEIAARSPEVQSWESWTPSSASGINLDSLTTFRGPYRSLRHFKLDNAYPIVQGYEDAAGTYAVAGGMRLNFSDRIGTTALALTASYSPDRDLSSFERLHLGADFYHWKWRVSANLNRANFYDLFGPTKTSRRGYSLALQYQDYLFFDAPRSLGYTLRLAGYGGLETVPEYQNVAASFDKLLSFSANLAYGSLRKSLGAIDDELGTTWGLTLRSNYVNRTLYPRLNLDVSKGFLLPLHHSSLWFRASAGAALAGDRNEPFANFFFGGFGNNWVDYRAIQQFRNTESFPGIEINEVGGGNYGRVQVEWMLPPLRFRRVGIPSFYLRWAGLSFFATGLMTNVDEPTARRTLASVGAQLDFRVVTLSHLNSTFSIGFAVARERGVPLNSAWMFSFKIM